MDNTHKIREHIKVISNNSLITDWDAWYLNLCIEVSKKSKDPSTKCGAIIARPDKTQLSMGYNNFPMGMDDADHLYEDRGVKLDRIIHAEMNAIIFAPERPVDCTLYVWPFLPCSRCAVHVIQSGITRIVAPDFVKDKWIEDFGRSLSYFNEKNIRVDLANYGDFERN